MFWKIFIKSLRNLCSFLLSLFTDVISRKKKKKKATGIRFGRKTASDQPEELTPMDKAQYASSDMQYDMEIWSFQGKNIHNNYRISIDRDTEVLCPTFNLCILENLRVLLHCKRWNKIISSFIPNRNWPKFLPFARHQRFIIWCWTVLLKCTIPVSSHSLLKF